VKLVVATRNEGKLVELRALLAPLGYALSSLSELGVEGDVVEDAPTFRGNAEKKARAALVATSLPALADDSGLEVDALGGAPGVLSARYAGTGHDDRANNARLLRELADIPDARRTARFRCALCLLAPDGNKIFVDGVCEGRIARAPRGEHGFGYDPLFFVEDGDFDGRRTMAELTLAEKNRVSHRARALAALSQQLKFGGSR
jgi:XTP/dITP diphosphohydrolase